MGRPHCSHTYLTMARRWSYCGAALFEAQVGVVCGPVGGVSTQVGVIRHSWNAARWLHCYLIRVQARQLICLVALTVVHHYPLWSNDFYCVCVVCS